MDNSNLDNNNLDDLNLNENVAVPEETKTAEEVVAEAPVETPAETPAEVPVADSATITSVVDSVPTEAKKPNKSKAKFIIGGVIALVAIVAIVCIANAAKIANSFRKLTMDPDEYTQYVLNQYITDYSDAMFDRLRLANPSENKVVSTTARFEATEDFIDEMDIDNFDEDALSDVSLTVESYKYESLIQNTYSLIGQDGTVVFTADVIVDAEEEVAYYRCAELNETFYEVDLSENFSREEVMTISEIMNSITTEDIDVLNDLFNKYIGIALSQITDVDEYNETMKVEGVSQKFTALEFDITSELCSDMLVAVFEEMIDDEVLADFADSKIPDDFDYTWDDATDVLSSIVDMVDEGEFEDEDFDLGTVTFYVNSKGEIKGFYFESEEDFEMTVIEIVHGSKFAFEYSIETRNSEVSLTGVGKMTFGRINAHFVLDTGDVELEADLKNGVFNSRKMSGEITINLEDWFDELNLITDDNEDVIEDMVLTVKFNFTVNEYTVVLDFLNGDNMGATITYSTTVSKLKTAIDAPDDTEDDIDDYIDDCDPDALEDNLRDFGFSRSEAEDITNRIMDELQFISSMLARRADIDY